MDDCAGAWLDTELDDCDLADQRLTKRLRKVLTQLGGAMGQSVPLACQDWANTKARSVLDGGEHNATLW